MDENLAYITDAISKTDLEDTDAIVRTMTDPVYLEKLNNLIDDQVTSGGGSHVERASRTALPASKAGSVFSPSYSNVERAERSGFVERSNHNSGSGNSSRKTSRDSAPSTTQLPTQKANRPVLIMEQEDDGRDVDVSRDSRKYAMPAKAKTTAGSTVHNKSSSPYVVSDTVTKLGDKDRKREEPKPVPVSKAKSVSGRGRSQDKFIDNDDMTISGSPIALRKNAIEDVTFEDTCFNVSLRSFKCCSTDLITASIENGIAKIQAQSDDVSVCKTFKMPSHLPRNISQRNLETRIDRAKNCLVVSWDGSRNPVQPNNSRDEPKRNFSGASAYSTTTANTVVPNHRSNSGHNTTVQQSSSSYRQQQSTQSTYGTQQNSNYGASSQLARGSMTPGPQRRAVQQPDNIKITIKVTDNDPRKKTEPRQIYQKEFRNQNMNQRDNRGYQSIPNLHEIDDQFTPLTPIKHRANQCTDYLNSASAMLSFFTNSHDIINSPKLERRGNRQWNESRDPYAGGCVPQYGRSKTVMENSGFNRAMSQCSMSPNSSRRIKTVQEKRSEHKKYAYKFSKSPKKK